MELLARIRSESKEIHDRLEGISGVFKIMDGTISEAEYYEILRKNYIAFAKAEHAITEHSPLQSRMSERILKDLQRHKKTIDTNKDFSLRNKFEALGARYVLVGSSLGATIIGEKLKLCKNIQQQDWYFYRRPNAEEQRIWPEVLKDLKRSDYSEEQEADILEGVMKTFKMFEKAYQL